MSIALLSIGGVIVLGGGIWGLYLAFKEDSSEGLKSFFIPFYGLYYAFSRWKETKRPFITSAVGVVLFIVGVVTLFTGVTGDVKPIITQFMEAAEAKDMDVAYSCFSSRFDKEEVSTFINSNYTLFEGYTDVSISSVSMESSAGVETCSIGGVIVYTDDTRSPFNMSLIKELDAWKLVGFQIDFKTDVDSAPEQKPETSPEVVTTPESEPESESESPPETDITFTDGNLKDIVMKTVGKEDFSVKDLGELRQLDADNMGITDLSGIEQCVNLSNLFLNDNQISDLSPLTSLKGLEALALTGNRITDIYPLVENSGLGNGDVIWLSENPLSAKSQKEYIPQLEQRGVRVIWSPAPETTTPEPEPTPPSETFINFPNTKLKDVIIKTLGKEDFTAADLAGLTELDAAGRMIADLSGIEHCVNLIELDLSNNNISDISALSSLTSLEKLKLGTNKISDISALSSLTSLEKLGLSYNEISDISALSSLVNLKGFGAGDNNIVDLSPLSSLTNLEILILGKNMIRDISPLLNLPNLTRVQLGDNSLSSESRNEYAPQLEERGVTVFLYLTPPPDWWD